MHYSYWSRPMTRYNFWKNISLNPFEKHLACTWWSIRMATITQIMKSCILVMVEIPIVWLDRAICEQPCVCLRGCVHMHLYMFAHKPVHPCVPRRLRASVECGWNMVLIWLFAHPAPCRLTPPMLSLGHLVRRRRGFELGWGVRGEVYTGKVWDRLHNQPGTLLSNYYTMEEGRAGNTGRVCLAICVAVCEREVQSGSPC